MIICKTGPGYENSQATCSPAKWDGDIPVGYAWDDMEQGVDMNWDYNNVTWQRKGQEIMILPPYEFCPEVCIALDYAKNIP